MRAIEDLPEVFAFGRWRLRPHRRELLLDGTPVHLGGRTFDLLLVLVEARGELVTKDEILRHVWPGIVVEENTLQAQVSALRKALGQDRDYLKTVSGRGYRFSAGVASTAASEPVFVVGTSPLPVARGTTNLPVATSDLIGREAEVMQVVDLVASHRLVTLVGAGGIGKTRLGLEVAGHLLSRFPDGVWIAELASLSDPDLVPATVAASLGLELAPDASSAERIAGAVRSKRLLLVLDNCEHVVEAAARLAETLLRAGSGVRIMATSREPLRADAEVVFRVPPLAVPEEGTQHVEQLLRAGAVSLFVARARAAAPAFVPDEQSAAMIAAICRRLDGIPLAVELAAASAAALGLDGLARRLDVRFGLLTGGRRTALPRHQTLRATLDWSYELLCERERAVLRRLSVFVGSFTLDAASAVASSEDIGVADVVDCLASLVSKSLVTVDAAGSTMVYRLLKTTRGYALEKLIQVGEFESCTRYHAEYCRTLFERAEAEAETRSAAAWLAVYGRWIDDVRAALDWTFSLGDDAPLGIALTAASVPLWLHLSLMEECRERVRRALAAVDRNASAPTRQEMQLHAALGAAETYAGGPGSDSCAAWTRVLEIARGFDDAEYQLRALYGLWIYRMSRGDYRIALSIAERFRSRAADAAESAESADRLIGDRLVGGVLHYLGDQTAARSLIEAALGAPASRSGVIRFQLDQRVVALAYVARILWLQGYPEQAMRTAQRAVEDARASNHALSLCLALATGTCPVALLAADLAELERSAAMLLERSATLAFGAWSTWGRCFAGLLAIKRGDLSAGLHGLGVALDELAGSKVPLRYTLVYAELGEALGRNGQIMQGLAVVDRALDHCQSTEERWCAAELLRTKGELFLMQSSTAGAAMAEAAFLEAIDCARRQGALSWELRGATSLARLWHEQDRSQSARELLEPVYARFTEGFCYADLAKARALLDEISTKPAGHERALGRAAQGRR